MTTFQQHYDRWERALRPLFFAWALINANPELNTPALHVPWSVAQTLDEWGWPV